MKNVKKFSEDKIVEQKHNAEVCTCYIVIKQRYLLKQKLLTYSLINYFNAVVRAPDNANTTFRNHPHSHDLRVQQMDIPNLGCHESRRESRMGGTGGVIRSALHAAVAA